MALEPWFIFSISSAALWAISSVIDKAIVPRHIKTPIVPLFIVGLFNLISAFIVTLSIPYTAISMDNLILSILSGLLWGIVPFVYFTSILTQEVSRIISLFSISPLLVLIFSTAILNEVLAYEKYLGIFIIVAGSLLITLKSNGGNKFSINTKLLLVLVATFLISASQVLSKFVLKEVPYWNFYVWLALGTFLSTFLITLTKFNSLKTVAHIGNKYLGLLIVSRILGVLGLISFITALSFGFASLVSAAFSVQSLFIIVFAFILSLFDHHIEKLKGSQGLLKFIAIILVIFGVFIIGF